MTLATPTRPIAIDAESTRWTGAPRMRALCVLESTNQLYSGIGRNLFETARRLAESADAPDLLQLPGTVNPMHDDAEHDHWNDHLDQLDKAIAERFQTHTKRGVQHPNDDTDCQGNEYLAKE